MKIHSTLTATTGNLTGRGRDREESGRRCQQETQLGVLSIVDNAQDEIKKIDADQDKMRADPVMEQMFGGGGQDDE